MDNTISQQAAIKIIKNYCENGCVIAEDNWCPSCQREQFIKLLEALPSEPRWIPCSEKLPEEETDVIVCNANGDIQISRGSYSTEMKDYFIWYTTGWRFGKVIAWMALPEPYKERRTDGQHNYSDTSQLA